MKRAVGVLTAAVTSLVVFAGTALAHQSGGCYPPCTTTPPTVLGKVEHNGTAFTGSNISLGLVLLVVLVVIGVPGVSGRFIAVVPSNGC